MTLTYSLFWNLEIPMKPDWTAIVLLKDVVILYSTVHYDFRYCKRYFRWGKISRKFWKDISHGGNIHDTTPIFFIKAYGFNFGVGVIFTKKTKAQKLPPRENFHVYSNFLTTLLVTTCDDLDSCLYVGTHLQLQLIHIGIAGSAQDWSKGCGFHSRNLSTMCLFYGREV